MSSDLLLHPIGIIHSIHTLPEKTPIQPVYAQGCTGQVEVFAPFEEGLLDIEGFSRLILIYQLHQAAPVQLRVKPFLEDVAHGVFATRAPRRPNPIGLSIVRLIRREGRILHIEDVDILNGTPLLDIKPYIPRFDCFPEARGGWSESIDPETAARRGRRDYSGPASPPPPPASAASSDEAPKK